jgi:hypothetical protein
LVYADDTGLMGEYTNITKNTEALPDAIKEFDKQVNVDITSSLFMSRHQITAKCHYIKAHPIKMWQNKGI